MALASEILHHLHLHLHHLHLHLHHLHLHHLHHLHHLLSEHGVTARWKNLDLLVLVSRVRNEQQIDMGGFVESPDLSLRVPKLAFPDALPKFGERIEVDGTAYRISRVSIHPRSPLLTLTLSSTDE